MLELQCAHGGGKASRLRIAGTERTAIQIAGRIGVATARGIHYLARRIGRNLVETSLCIYQRTLAAKRHHHFFHAPSGKPQGSLVSVVEPRDDLHLVLVHFYYVGHGKYIELAFPIHGVHIVATHVAQIALCVDGYASVLRKILHHLRREIVGQERAQMIYAGVQSAHIVDGERVGFLQNALCALVLVLSILVLEIDSVAARPHLHIDARLAHQADGLHIFLAQLSDELERHLVRQTVKGVGKIERRASRHVNGLARCDDFVFCDVA